MSKTIYTLGADPEIFVSQAGKLVSAFGLIGGTKNDPLVVDRGAVQVDGMALEFNIDAAGSEEQWLGNINSVMATLESMVPGYKLECQAVAEFGAEYIKAQPEKAKELGCDPDYDAYIVGVNPRPNGDLPFRSAAGHIHVGIPETEGDAPVDDGDYIAYVAQKVRELDFYLALPSLFYDNDTKRRELYGKAGAFRPKKYGFEYRTLSNQWLKSDDLKLWAYRATQYGLEQMDKGISLFDKYGDAVQRIVNKSDKAEASRIIKAEGLLLPAGLVM